MKFWTFLLALMLALTTLQADAKRLGGGKSVGQQSSNVTQREATPPPPPAQAPAASPTTAPKRPWGAMLGGLAAGLGLAWLANSLGMGEGFGQVLMLVMLALLVVAGIGWFMRRRAANAKAPFAFQGAGNMPLSDARTYRAENVGNDASARPWERSSMGFEADKPPTGSMIGSGLSGSQSWGVPAGFDAEGFLKAAKTNFVNLQAAWDRFDLSTLRAMMTDAMLREIQAQLAEHQAQPGNSANHTEVVMLEAHLLGIEEKAGEYMASVEFSGMIREDASAGPNPFREVWNMTKPVNATHTVNGNSSGWLVAGVQALQ
ncbi:MAG: Tim44 domain-containing protein [Rhodoferax sp.]|nr:Tim44 domain-containing protein [Rhodoferax sp.]